MNVAVYLSSCCVAVVIFTPEKGLLQQTYTSQIRRGVGVKNGTVGLTIYGSSLSECSKECEDRPACAALDYIRTFHICKLYSRHDYVPTKVVLMPAVIHEYFAKYTAINSSTSVLVKCDQSNVCALTGCPLPVVDNGELRGTLVRFGARIQLECHYDFIAMNGSSAVCVGTGFWSHELRCVRESAVTTTTMTNNIEEITVKQWVYKVTSFSSQYLSDSWSANQVKGPPDVYPSYGDFPYAWAHDSNGNDDEFLELEYEQAVFITCIDIYETYHAGGVRAILGRESLDDGNIGDWALFWEAENGSFEYIEHARIFSPPLQVSDFLTKHIRIEVEVLDSNVYVEIDAIQMVGTKKVT